MIVDEEFQSLIPPLAEDEFKQLEENCLRDGIKHALVTWNGILIDGHNRLKIAEKHSLDYSIDEMEFPGREEAKLWIIKNQLGRRNLSAYDRSVLALKLKPIVAERAKERMLSGKSDPNQKSDEGMTSKKLGKIAGVSHDTIHKVETIQNSGDKKLIEDVRKGDVTINKAYQVVKGIEPKTKSPGLMKKEMLDQKRQEHEDFQNSKTVTIAEVMTDKANRKIIAKDLYGQLMVMGKRIEEISVRSEEGEIDIEGMAKELTQGEITSLVEMVGVWRRMLTSIVSKVTSK